MSTIHDTSDLVHASVRPRIGPTALSHGWREICLAMGEAVADILAPSPCRSPANDRAFADPSGDEPEPPPQPITEPTTPPDGSQLVWEVRRLLALSGRTLADVAHTLQANPVEVDDRARDLLQDELYALGMDLATLNQLLSDPVDWDSEYERLLAGDVVPFDEEPSEDDDAAN